MAKKKAVKTTEPPEDNSDFLVIGIGASAGGIQALKTFFENVPAKTGMAYVVILHLMPNHDSQLAQVLQLIANIPVKQVTEQVKVAPDHVYVVPPNHHLEMVDGHITVSANTRVEDRRAPVDIFFRTLSESKDSRAIAVILSGSGADGSMGLKRVKENGGVCFVQNPREAEFNEMPRNAIATGLVDDVLPVADIPAKIISYWENLGKIIIPAEPVEQPEEQQQALREIFTQLRVRTGHDFSNYKRPTLLRRIERRVNVCGLSSLSEYSAFLRDTPEETQALLKNFLISVTNFFRDPKVFEYVEQEIIPQILANKNSETALRVWIAGCATGEEAYTLAMLFCERIAGMTNAPKLQIFATDIDEPAITIARDGIYTINDAADVSVERLRRFFTKEGDEYRIRREIREMVLFAQHNAIKDPPFSHVDMVSCRNLLIYLNHTGQERLMETFHFALEPGGYLLLGMSETVDGASDLYMQASKENHIYKARQTPARTYPIPEPRPELRYQARIPDTSHSKETHANERISFGELHAQLLEQYAPPSVVVNEEYDIVHISERAGRFLQVSGGEPSKNLLKLIHPDLRLEIRAALYQSLQKRTNVEAKNLEVRIGDKTENLNIHIRPVLRSGEAASGFILILFESTGDPGEEKVLMAPDEPVARHLEEELIKLKSQLRSSVEQHEFQAEELKASNEELQAMNEELRSATEELETSKEELQSINEELSTVNQELKLKVEEVSHSSSNLQNLINSTNIGTIFLDRTFRVNMFTPAAREIFSLIANDYGRSLSDITHRLKDVDLHAEAEAVMNTLAPVEREVETIDGRSFLMRVLPYRMAEDRINGVVVTFIDITVRRKAEQDLRNNVERFAAFVTASSDIIYRMNPDWTEMADLKSEHFVAQTHSIDNSWLHKYIPEKDQERVAAAIDKAIANKSLFELEHRIIRADGTIGWAFSRAVPLLDAHRQIKEWFGAATDISSRKEAEAALRKSEERLEISIRGADIFTWEVNPLTKETKFSRNVREVLGFGASDISDENLVNIYPEDKQKVLHSLELAFQGKIPLDIEHRILNPESGSIMWVRVQGHLVKRTPDNPEVFVGVTQNITGQKMAKDALHESESRLQKAMQIETVGIVFFNDAGMLLDANDAYLKMIGYSKENLEAGINTADITMPEWMQRTMQAIEELKMRGIATPYEKELKRPDGSRWWALLAAARINENENVEYCIDITGRKSIEQALSASEERFRTVTDAVPQIIWANDEKGVAHYFNRRWYEYSGLGDNASVGLGWEAIVHPDDAAIAKEKWQRALSEGRIFETEYRLRNARNEYSWFIGRNVPLKDSNGKITGWFGSATDIELLKDAEVSLRRGTARLQLALSAGKLGSFEYNFSSDHVHSTMQNNENFGLPDRESLTIRKLFDMIVPEDRPGVEAAWNSTIDEDNIFDIEYRITLPGGNTRWIKSAGRAFYNDNGDPENLVAFTLDITNQKNYTSELTRAVNERTQELQRSNQDLLQFAHVTSHDLKEPVRKIRTFNGLLIKDFSLALPEKGQSYLDKIRIASDRMIAMIDGILNYSKIGITEEAFEPVDLNRVIARIKTDLELLIQEKRAEITVHNHPVIMAHATQMYQLFYNLIGNSLKFAREEEPCLIEISNENVKLDDRSFLKITVSDNGIGFEQEFEESIFEAFSRLHGKDEYEGTGLGLALCKKIMERHHGFISAKGRLGKGAEFSILLPQ